MSYHRPQSSFRPLNGPVEDVVASVVSRQLDAVLDTAGDRFSAYLDSPKGAAVMDKFEAKVETAIVNVAEKRKNDLLLIGLSATALAAVGVSMGARLSPRGTTIAGLVAVGALLPILIRKPETPPTPPRRSVRK